MILPVGPYLRIIRLSNVVMTGLGVGLGLWLGQSAQPGFEIALLVLAGMAATAFGNVINDLFDIPTDRLSHPDRPLPRGDISPRDALVFAIVLVITGLLSALVVSPSHFVGAMLPMVFLLLYAAWFKATPLMGNLLVSVLVAYPIIFGAMNTPLMHRVYLPALLALLLNLCREIAKDIQDQKGDRAQKLTTSASLPYAVLRTLLFFIAASYLLVVFLPRVLGHFGWAYAAVAALGVLPLHLFWARHLFSPQWPQKVGSISKVLKFEMLAGLAALAFDQALTGNI